jgi:hypothetical protein
VHWSKITFVFVIVWILVFVPGDAHARLLVETSGAETVVFLHDRDACQPMDIPDAPARAFRDLDGRVHLFATHFINLGYVGPNLNAVKRDCRIAYQGEYNNDPAVFNDHEWLTSFWTNDGRTVYALIHNEFQANLRPSLCPSRVYDKCWYNAVTAAISHDGGFQLFRPAHAIVAAPAYRFDNKVGRPVGYFMPSTIIKRGGYYYDMVWAENVGAQKRGVCLLRTHNLADPESWRAWDGRGFTVRLGNPYLKPAGTPPHVCALIDPAHLHSHIASLVRHGPTGRYIVMMSFEGDPHPGFYFSDRADLFHWSEPVKVMDIGPAVPGECGNRPVFAYPSLLDPNSPSRNFDVVGDAVYLYFTRFHPIKCAGNLNRDLLRVPVTIQSSQF